MLLLDDTLSHGLRKRVSIWVVSKDFLLLLLYYERSHVDDLLDHLFWVHSRFQIVDLLLYEVVAHVITVGIGCRYIAEALDVDTLRG